MVRFRVALAALPVLAAGVLLAGCGGSGAGQTGGPQAASVVSAGQRVCAELPAAVAPLGQVAQTSQARLPRVATMQHASARLSALTTLAYHDPGGNADVGNLLGQASVQLGYAAATARTSYLVLADQNIQQALTVCSSAAG